MHDRNVDHGLFTFQTNSFSYPTLSGPDVPDVATHSTKRPPGHPHRPTPENSPRKKRVWVVPAKMDAALPLPRPLFLPTASQPKTLDNAAPAPDTLFSFWSTEMADQRAFCNQKDFEQLKNTKEQCDFEAERLIAKQKDRLRARDRERQQIQRDKARAQKVANGWKPSVKRVSNWDALLDPDN